MDIQARVNDFNQKHSMAKMLINSSDIDKWIIHIDGELDLHSSADAQSILETLLEELPSRSTLIFNLEKLVYISSTGVGIFANLVVAANKRRIPVILKKLQPKVEQIFNLLGILSYFNIEK
ncbi:STAS domain-containing protein [Gracilinema caldarium]|uniref:Anti-sigma factor antagonist n=1 Tax=Gracilinema caldarium (strain ATCC 51460 / DSM 7334 / H1) TaxID=744872 RepID=F8EXA6_GRAC1|nr:STAS domain-containing protein [Gracilinema caldarium]AEJ18849.1 Sulfate transporter/antisigma-factor antagonist STAS [Gracilinema caldarium DSM 7334]